MQDKPEQSRIGESGNGDTVRVPQGERTATDVLRVLEDGKRVVIDIDGFDGSMEATVRKKGDIYYCDTATKLLTYESADALRTALEKYQLVDPDAEPDAAVGS
jgi:hypothetical protein